MTRSGLIVETPREGRSGGEGEPVAGQGGVMGTGEGVVGRVLARVSREVGEDRFRRYFDPTTRVRVDGRVVDVSAASGFVADLLTRRLSEPLRRAASEELGEQGVEVRIHVEAPAVAEDSAPAAAARAAEGPSRRAETKPAGRGGVGPSRALRLRLDDFVVGESNRVAFGAAVRVGEGTYDLPGPLFLHGPCGVGKTHLLQGTALRFLERRPGAVVRYTTAEAFTNEYITAIRAGSMAAFRRSYRTVDLLCLDDVHFLSNKESTQRELLHTFDAAGLSRGRVVLASDEHPRAIASLSDQLASRFVAGAVIRVEPPEAGLRERLVRHVAARRGLSIEDGAVTLIAERAGAEGGPWAGGSVRDLEGCVARVEASALVMPELCPSGSIGLALARRALGLCESPGAGVPRPRRPIPLGHLVAEVCGALNVPAAEFTGRGRHKTVVLARELAVYLARRMTTQSFPEIARAFGRTNHSTALTAYQRFEKKVAAGEPAPGDLPPGLSGLTMGELAERVARRAVRSDE
ncbi:MAG: ATP-binding protein [Phycisphaeraceae bacterium]|nr:MAG: ATP-binding protein [Phycisphaeraceae bacterium]